MPSNFKQPKAESEFLSTVSEALALLISQDGKSSGLFVLVEPLRLKLGKVTTAMDALNQRRATKASAVRPELAEFQTGAGSESVDWEAKLAESLLLLEYLKVLSSMGTATCVPGLKALRVAGTGTQNADVMLQAARVDAGVSIADVRDRVDGLARILKVGKNVKLPQLIDAVLELPADPGHSKAGRDNELATLQLVHRALKSAAMQLLGFKTKEEAVAGGLQLTPDGSEVTGDSIAAALRKFKPAVPTATVSDVPQNLALALTGHYDKPVAKMSLDGAKKIADLLSEIAALFEELKKLTGKDGKAVVEQVKAWKAAAEKPAVATGPSQALIDAITGKAGTKATEAELLARVGEMKAAEEALK